MQQGQMSDCALKGNFLVYLACIWQPEYFFQPSPFMNTKQLEQFLKWTAKVAHLLKKSDL